MSKKGKPKIKVIRNGETVDPHSTQIRIDQSKRLKTPRPPTIRNVGSDHPVKLNSKAPRQIYTAGIFVECTACKVSSPTKRMYEYPQSSRGRIVLCESCDEIAELRSFYKLDALDRPRKQYKVD